jgi:type II secretory pathway pseudopilin PulG
MVLLSIVAATVFAVINFERNDRARQRRSLNDLVSAASALEAFRVKYNHYPAGSDWKIVADRLVQEGMLITDTTKDRWGYDFRYRADAVGGARSEKAFARSYEMRSCGRDGICESRPGKGLFSPTDYDEDLVIINGQLVNRPEGYP